MLEIVPFVSYLTDWPIGEDSGPGEEGGASKPPTNICCAGVRELRDGTRLFFFFFGVERE